MVARSLEGYILKRGTMSMFDTKLKMMCEVPMKSKMTSDTSHLNSWVTRWWSHL
jgi:hypothetical protein